MRISKYHFGLLSSFMDEIRITEHWVKMDFVQLAEREDMQEPGSFWSVYDMKKPGTGEWWVGDRRFRMMSAAEEQCCRINLVKKPEKKYNTECLWEWNRRSVVGGFRLAGVQQICPSQEKTVWNLTMMGWRNHDQFILELDAEEMHCRSLEQKKRWFQKPWKAEKSHGIQWVQKIAGFWIMQVCSGIKLLPCVKNICLTQPLQAFLVLAGNYLTLQLFCRPDTGQFYI